MPKLFIKQRGLIENKLLLHIMKRIVDQIELFLLCFTVFMIPIHIKLTSVSIALLLVLAFFKKENLSQFKNIYKNPRFIILIFPYLFFLLGLINTNYMVDGWSAKKNHVI